MSLLFCWSNRNIVFLRLKQPRVFIVFVFIRSAKHETRAFRNSLETEVFWTTKITSLLLCWYLTLSASVNDIMFCIARRKTSSFESWAWITLLTGNYASKFSQPLNPYRIRIEVKKTTAKTDQTTWKDKDCTMIRASGSEQNVTNNNHYVIFIHFSVYFLRSHTLPRNTTYLPFIIF